MSEEEKVDLSKFVAKEEFLKLNNDYQAMLGRYKSAEQKLNELSETVTNFQKVKEEKDLKSGENMTLKQQVTQLQEAMKKGEERAERLKKSAARQTIIREMTKAGGDQTLVELAADSILATKGRSIIAAENDQGDYTVSYEDPITGEVKPVTDFVSSYMASDIGKKLVPVKSNPNVNSRFNNEPLGEKIRVTRMEANKLTTEQLDSGLVEFID